MSFVNTSLFVGDLPKFCSESDLEQFFSGFGPVLDVKIKRNVNTGKTLSYGFVTLSSEPNAAEAIRATDGAMFLGRKLRVRWAMYNAKTQQPTNHNIINSVYVRFVTTMIDQYVTEEDLHRVFDPFGCVLDVSIKESAVDIRSNRQSGYGFVHFSCDAAGIEAAFQAVAALDNSTVENITFNVELSKNLLKQFNTESSMNKEEFGSVPMTPTQSSSSANNVKQLTSPSRSMNNIYQSPSNMAYLTPTRSQTASSSILELESSQASLSSPYQGLSEHRTPLRQCSSMNAIKFNSSPQHPQQNFPRGFAGRGEGVPVSSPYYGSYQQQPLIAGSVVTSPNNNSNVLPNVVKHLSRENSFRSMGGRSGSGSFRALNARSSSANSMTSSYGTTVSCTSSPSPLIPVHVESNHKVFDKIQSFRSDPGANNAYRSKSNRFSAGLQDAINSPPAGSTHSLSFHDSPLSRSLFSIPNHSQYMGSESSHLLGVSSGFGPSSVLAESPVSAYRREGEARRFLERPESRASNCSDVSTDEEEDPVLVSGFDFFSANSKENDYFFEYLSKNKGSLPANDLSIIATDFADPVPAASLLSPQLKSSLDQTTAVSGRLNLNENAPASLF